MFTDCMVLMVVHFFLCHSVFISAKAEAMQLPDLMVQ